MNTLPIYLTRLIEDEADVRALEARCRRIRARARAPDLLEVRFGVAGLHRQSDGEIVVGREHLAQVYRPPTYPVDSAPVVVMMTPGVQHVHPNIDPLSGGVCYGVSEPERWAPSLGLDHILLLVARMLRLEVFDVTDPIRDAVGSAEYVRRLSQAGGTPLESTPLEVPRRPTAEGAR